MFVDVFLRMSFYPDRSIMFSRYVFMMLGLGF